MSCPRGEKTATRSLPVSWKNKPTRRTWWWLGSQGRLEIYYRCVLIEKHDVTKCCSCVWIKTSRVNKYGGSPKTMPTRRGNGKTTLDSRMWVLVSYETNKVYIYIYTHKYIYVYMHICKHANMYGKINTFDCIIVWLYNCIVVCMDACMDVCMYDYVCMYVRTYVHIHVM